MNERRREAAHLGRRAARNRRRHARTAVELVELERHPGHRLLDGVTHGITAGRCATARETRDRMWHDFAAWTEILDADPTPAALDHAEVLAADVGAALATLQALATACETARRGVLEALAPVAEQLAGTRRTVDDLGLAADDPDALAATALRARASEIERDAAGDPLGYTGGPHLDVGGPVAALCARLDALTRLRDGWGAVVAGLDRDVDDVADRHAAVVRERARVGAQVRDRIPARPPDRGPELAGLREAVTAACGWRARLDAVVALRDRVAGARAELDAGAALVTELLDRRDDLRGRFGVYRARTRRLGCADDPELTELAARIGTRLWAVPSEIARATRDLAAYRRRLAALSTR